MIKLKRLLFGVNRAVNNITEEPDAVVPHVRFWGEGGGAIPSLTRQQTVRLAARR